MLGPFNCLADEIEETANLMQGAKDFLVKNFVKRYLILRMGQDDHNFIPQTQRRHRAQHPQTYEMAFEEVEIARCRSSSYRTQGPMTRPHDLFVRRAYVRHWLTKSGRNRPYQANRYCRPSTRARVERKAS